MKSARHRTYCLALLAALAIGCQANQYEIKLTPKANSLDRQLTCWREHRSQDKTQVVSFPEDELEQIAGAYAAPVPVDKAKKHQFSAEFAADMPDDVGGSGSYTHWETPLGSVSAYVERFRGDDNLMLEVDKRQRAADRMADLLAGWFAAELAGQPEFAELQQFLEDDFRQDLKNVSLYGWAYNIVSAHADDAEQACVMRVGQYLSERGYFKPDQLPVMTRAIADLEKEDPAKLLGLIQRFIAGKMGIAEDQPLPECLDFLATTSAIEASSSSYLRGTDEYKRLLESWEAVRASNPEAEKPKPSEVLGELVTEALLSNFNLFGGGSDKLAVTLESAIEPFQTNGSWDETVKQVNWSQRLAARDSEQTEFPTLLYALWSIPNETKQKDRFGQVVLDGQALGEYCLWYRGLAAQEATEWDKFVTSLQPGNDLVGRLSEFRFSHERADGADEQYDLASTPRDLILSALTGELANDPSP